jgi:hypothetical protein
MPTVNFFRRDRVRGREKWKGKGMVGMELKEKEDFREGKCEDRRKEKSED